MYVSFVSIINLGYLFTNRRPRRRRKGCNVDHLNIKEMSQCPTSINNISEVRIVFYSLSVTHNAGNIIFIKYYSEICLRFKMPCCFSHSIKFT